MDRFRTDPKGAKQAALCGVALVRRRPTMPSPVRLAENGLLSAALGNLTLKGYSMDLLCKDNPLDLYDPDWPMLPAQQGCRPTRFSYSVDKVPGIAIDSLVSGGCVIEGATVDHCVLSENVYVGPASIVQDSIIFPGATIGARCRLKRVILSEDCHVPDGSVVGIDTRLDRLSFEVSDGGVALVNNESLQRQAMSQKAVA